MTALLLWLCLAQSMRCSSEHCSGDMSSRYICTSQCTMPDGSLKTCFRECVVNPSTGSASCTVNCY